MQIRMEPEKRIKLSQYGSLKPGNMNGKDDDTDTQDERKLLYNDAELKLEFLTLGIFIILS